MPAPCNNVLETIGNTPIVRISKLAPPGVDLFVKLEAFNPMGSIKDRLAIGVIEDAERSGRLRLGQTVVEANADIHSRTTAPEILDSFQGRRLDYWVTGFGTGGTLKGVSRIIKAERPETRVVVCEPDNSQILGSGIPQERASDGSPSASHPGFRPHLMQGWSPDFIPKLAEDVATAELIDEIVPVKGADALRCSRNLAQQEGIFTGISGGATFAGALDICAGAPAGSAVL